MPRLPWVITYKEECDQLGPCSPKVYGLPQIHRKNTPLYPYFPVGGSVTYKVAKELARVPELLFVKSTHHVNNAQNFVEHIKNLTLGKRNGSPFMMSQDYSPRFR